MVELAASEGEKDLTDGRIVCKVCGGRYLNGRSEINGLYRCLLGDESTHRLDRQTGIKKTEILISC